MIQTYQVVRETELDRLEMAVGGVLSARVGWELAGGVSAVSQPDGTVIFCQALHWRPTLRVRLMMLWDRIQGR